MTFETGDAELCEVFKKELCIVFRKGFERSMFLLAISDSFIIYVGEIHERIDFIPEKFQTADDDIFKGITTEISNMSIIIDRWPTTIEFYPIIDQWFKIFSFS